MSRDQKINFISLIIIIGFLISVFYHYVMGSYLGLGYPFNTFLCGPNDKFGDFFNIYFRSKGSNLSTEWPFFNAPPMGYLIIYPFTILEPSVSFILFLLIFVIFIFYISTKNLNDSNKLYRFRNVFAFSFLTYPCIFLIDRGNVEALAFIFIYLFVFCYQDKRFVISTFYYPLQVT